MYVNNVVRERCEDLRTKCTSGRVLQAEKTAVQRPRDQEEPGVLKEQKDGCCPMGWKEKAEAGLLEAS